MRFEFLIRHDSNAFTSSVNPRVDGPTIRLAYALGRLKP
jgi:hypothetical protein